MFIKITIFIFIFISIVTRSQQPIDSTNFRSPLTIPLIVAGNFGELRSNHFHTGLDIKTGGVKGKKTVSIEAGFISRIAVSHYGYGNVLYIDHPNGYTSVYAHLSKFSDKINKKVRAIQQEQESEAFDVKVDSYELRLAKGEYIALTGNSGSSFAPHLHFEIRETGSEHPVNPLLFGFTISDKTKPDIKGIKFYPLSSSSTINGIHKEVYVSTSRISTGNYKLSLPIKAYGEIGLGTHSTDRLDGAGNVCGIFNLDMYCDDKKVFNHNLTYMDFSLSRYINQHKDYYEFHKRRRNIHKNFLKGNNLLPIYGTKINNGIIDVKTDSTYEIKYDIKDSFGNISYLNFEIKGENKPLTETIEDTSNCIRYFNYSTPNYFDTANFNILMDANTLYDNQCISYNAKQGNNLLSKIHTIVDEDIPVHKYYKLQIKGDTTFDSVTNSKLLIVDINLKGQKINRGGEFLNGYVSTRVNEFGSYAVAIDTIKPYVLLKKGAKSLQALRNNSKLTFSISDNLSGIDSYKVFIDNKWILSNYNRRNGRLTVDLVNTALTKGTHILKVIITDERQNVNESIMDIKIL
jgi:hypothetical protein